MAIELKNAKFVYMPGTPYEQTAVQGLNLTIQQREFVGILGHTGSGKSTLVQLMGGLLTPMDGQIQVDGVDINQKTALARTARQKVGIVFQYPEHQLFEETVYEDIAFGPRNVGCEEEEVDRRVRAAMEFVALPFDGYAQRSPLRLSGGEMRRVAIAGVIALQPQYLILDEPAAGLDPRGRDEIFGEIMRCFRETGITVIMISHNIEDLLRMAQRLLVMRQGEIVWEGEPTALFSLPAEKLQAAGVEPPPLEQLLHYLRQQGLPLPAGIVDVGDGAEQILRLLGGAQHD